MYLVYLFAIKISYDQYLNIQNLLPSKKNKL